MTHHRGRPVPPAGPAAAAADPVQPGAGADLSPHQRLEDAGARPARRLPRRARGPGGRAGAPADGDGRRSVGLAAEVVRHWIECDTASRILTAIIAENAARRTLALEAFRSRDVAVRARRPLPVAEAAGPVGARRLRPRRLDRGVKITPRHGLRHRPALGRPGGAGVLLGCGLARRSCAGAADHRRAAGRGPRRALAARRLIAIVPPNSRKI